MPACLLFLLRRNVCLSCLSFVLSVVCLLLFVFCFCFAAVLARQEEVPPVCSVCSSELLGLRFGDGLGLLAPLLPDVGGGGGGRYICVLFVFVACALVMFSFTCMVLFSFYVFVACVGCRCRSLLRRLRGDLSSKARKPFLGAELRPQPRNVFPNLFLHLFVELLCCTTRL